MATIYCWGNTAHGELGLGGIEDEQILTPRKINWNPPISAVAQVSCGSWHTLFLSSCGKIYSCGCNDNGQLGHELPTKRPRMSPFKLISELDNYFITNISCGARHSMAISEWGQLFTWGHNDYGQLGFVTGSQDHIIQPKIVRNLISKVVVQIASGNNHCLALTNCGELYSWGSNIYGQLGVASTSNLVHANTPRLVTALNGIPIAYIACGGNHSFVISKSGAVFGWGRNDCGQLGLNDITSRCYPSQLKTLRSLGVRYIKCGEEFSVFLTNDGGVFTCGSGRYGQLGHGGNANEVLPRMVVELMGSTVTQVTCGSRHTLALVASRGRVYGFGLGCSGQLGTRTTNNASVPQVVLGPWVSPSGQALIKTEDISDINDNSCHLIKQIYSGGDHSLVTCTFFEDKIPAVDCRIYDEKTQVLFFNEESAKKCADIERDGIVDMDLLTFVELIFKSQACLNGSFLLEDDRHLCCTSKHHGVNIVSATKAFTYLRNVENETLKTLIWDKVTNDLLNSLVQSPADVETLRIFLILPLYHEFVNSKNYEKLHTRLSNAVVNLNEIPRKIVAKWWSQTPSDWFEHLVLNYKNVIAYIISFKIPLNIGSSSRARHVRYNSNLVAALNLIVFLHGINKKERKDKLHYEVFHWPELADFVDIQQDYMHWTFNKNPDAFNICNYPMLFNAAAKTTLLQTDQALQMHHAMQNASANSIFSLFTTGQPMMQFIVLNVSRENLVDDTLREIMKYNQNDWKKPLKVKFHGEEAEDAGGVRKEFFMLLLKDLIDPKYGMFKEYEDSRAVWFADMTFETDSTYFLIGIICGLAIYNFTIINLPFPLALYKKLLQENVDLTDLRELSPTLANSMQQILDYDGDDFEETFDLHFEISREIFGEAASVALKPNGENVSVTKENRQEFVDLYVDFIFNKAVDDKFKAFQKGFMNVCWGRVLKIFRPEELMAMVVGNEEYDWQALELSCEYKNGYTSSDDTIKWFWEVFHDLSIADKKKFLLYLTGSDRIPIQGMKAIKICIQPTNDEKCLPVAHTCFNLLDLPLYKTKERLKYKLLQALQQTQGFSLV